MSDGSSNSSAGTSGAAGGNAGQSSGGDGNAGVANTGQATSTESQADETTEAEPQAETQKTEESAKEKQLHKLQMKLRETFKDRKFEKPEDDFDAADEHITHLEKYKEDNIKENKKLWDLFKQHDVLGDILQDLDQGADFKEALARHVDLTNIEPYDDEPDYDKWNKAKQERIEKQKSREKAQQEFDANMQQSVKTFEEFGKELGYDAGKAKEFTSKIDGVISELNKGVVSKRFLTMMQKAFEFDEAVKDAAETGEVKGRNEQIEVKKESIKEKAGDGIPDINISGKSENLDKPEPERQKDIWSQGIQRQLQREKRALGEK